MQRSLDLADGVEADSGGLFLLTENGPRFFGFIGGMVAAQRGQAVDLVTVCGNLGVQLVDSFLQRGRLAECFLIRAARFVRGVNSSLRSASTRARTSSPPLLVTSPSEAFNAVRR